MLKEAVLSLDWRIRPGEGSREAPPFRTERRFLDFVVNGESLFVSLPAGDQVTQLGPWNAETETRAIEQLLLERAGEGQQGRVPLYVCSECGDLRCGALTAIVERTPEGIVWRDFGFEYFEATDDTYVIDREPYSGCGPFLFDEDAYHSALRKRPYAAV